jgi:hypothetical protein
MRGLPGIDFLIATPSVTFYKVKKPRLDLMEISPAVALEKLRTIKSNRPLVKKHVNAFSRLMKKGLFRNYSVIHANGQGEFYDGQHRLHALISTGTTAIFTVLRGLDSDDNNMLIDSGKKRTNQNRLSSKYRNAGMLAGAAEESLDVLQHWRKSVSMIFPDEIFTYLQQNPDLVDYAGKYPVGRVNGFPGKYIIAFQHLFGKIDPDKASMFFAQLSRPDLREPGDPTQALIDMMESPLYANETDRSKQLLWLKNGILTAWNAVYAGKRLDKITPRIGTVELDGVNWNTETPPVDESAVGGEEESEEDEGFGDSNGE